MSARSPSRAGTIARVALLNTVRTVLRADVHPRATVVEPHVHAVPAPARGDHGDRGNDDQGPANLLHGGLRRRRATSHHLGPCWATTCRRAASSLRQRAGSAAIG